VKHLVESRALSTGMGNVIKFLRQEIANVSPELSESDAKTVLLESMLAFHEEKVG
jgi:hypothetical protein